MMESIRHRGPDDSGFIGYSSPSFGHLWLGHQRLFVRDLSKAAAQPMTDDSGRFSLIYNGEIYNAKEIREELKRNGDFHFRSKGDTEILLKAWAKWGKQTPEKLQGEFAFAILDRSQGKLFLCRDRLGIKPLYYSMEKSKLAFASEVRALVIAGFGKSLNSEGVDGYLTFGSIPEPLTIYQGVFSLPAGSTLEVDLESQKTLTQKFWKNPFLSVEYKERKEFNLDELEFLLRDAVSCRLVSDVPLGAFLSGGVDSSCLVASAAKILSTPLQTFLLDFPEPEYSEAFYAERVSDQFGTHHRRVLFSNKAFQEELPKALQAFDQPSMDGMNSYFVCQAAKQSGLTVALSGVGADELFAGYETFRRGPRSSFLAHLPFPLRRLLARVLSQGNSVARRKMGEFVSGDCSLVGSYAVMRSVFLEKSRRFLLRRETRTASDWMRAFVDNPIAERDPINFLCGLELEFYLKNTLLRDLDVLSMQHSLEVRAPFLDHRLVEYMANTPGNLKLAPGLNKPLLVRTLGRDLPRECVKRSKRGFSFPWRPWILGALAPEMKRAFEEGASKWEELGISPSSAKAIYGRFQQGKDGVEWGHVWTLFMLARWNEARSDSARAVKNTA